ncbi:MAG: sensor histidine kinase [Flavobacteriales bacterium]|nr:sensor histidine kinase [Flavobacteriales bacterium]
MGTTAAQRSFTDSLLANPANDADERALGRVFIARAARAKGQARRALEMLDSVRTDPDKSHSLVRYAIPNERARGLKSLKMFAEAMQEAERSHRFAVAFNLREEEVNALVLMAEIHRARGEYEQAMTKLIEAERLSSNFGYAMGLCNVAINRSNLLNLQERYADALIGYRSARYCGEANGFTQIAHNALFNEAGILTLAFPDSVEVGIAIYRTGLDAARSSGDRSFEAELRAELGRTLNSQKRYREAILELKAAVFLHEKLGDTLNTSAGLLFLSTSYKGADQLDSALEYAHRATKLSSVAGDLDREADGLLREAEILTALARYDEANAGFREYIDKARLLSEAKNGEAIKVMEYRFETEKKENTIKVQNEQITSDRLKKRGMMVIGGLLVLVSGLLVRNNQHIRRVNAQERQLHERAVTDMLKQQEIRTLDAMMQGQETERGRIAKDLHDRLGSMLSAIKLQFSALESRLDKEQKLQERQFKQVFGMLDEAVSEVRRISHDLLKSSLSRFGLKGALEELRDTIHVPGKLEVETNLFGLEERLEQRVEVATYRIVQECISNALKHAQATTLAIQVTRSSAMINIIVEDNGKGFDPLHVQEGMGMGNLRQRAAELGGVVGFDSRPGRGTTVNIDIPLTKQGA